MAHKKYTSKPQRDHYQEVTDQIVAALEQGIIPWRRTWNQGACGVPMNCTTAVSIVGSINFCWSGPSRALWK